MFRKLLGAVVALGLGLAALPASADEVADLEGLRADLYPDGSDWVVKVRYDVELEGAHPEDRYLLALQFSDDDCRVMDAEGRPVEVVVPLERPTGVDAHELVFRNAVEARLPGGAVRRPHALRVHGAVLREGESHIRDEKSTAATAHLPVVYVESPRVVEVVRPAPVVHVIERPAPVVYAAPVVRVIDRGPVVHVVDRGPRTVVVRRPGHVRVVRSW